MMNRNRVLHGLIVTLFLVMSGLAFSSAAAENEVADFFNDVIKETKESGYFPQKIDSDLTFIDERYYENGNIFEYVYIMDIPYFEVPQSELPALKKSAIEALTSFPEDSDEAEFVNLVKEYGTTVRLTYYSDDSKLLYKIDILPGEL